MEWENMELWGPQGVEGSWAWWRDGERPQTSPGNDPARSVDARCSRDADLMGTSDIGSDDGGDRKGRSKCVAMMGVCSNTMQW